MTYNVSWDVKPYSINQSWESCHTPRIFNVIVSLISLVRSFTELYLSDVDNIASFENTTLINLISLLCVLLFDLIILIDRYLQTVKPKRSEIRMSEFSCYVHGWLRKFNKSRHI